MDRTKKALYNSIVVIVSSIVLMGFMLLRTKLIIKYYGEDINGLIQTVTQVQTYLLLLESGMCSAYLYRMYKPIANKNNLEISQLFKGFSISIKKIAIKMLIVAIIVSLILPLIIKNDSIRNYNIIFISILMCLRFIIPYFYSIVPQYMLNLKELKYKTEIILFIRESLTYLLEIILILKKYNILIVLLIGILMNIVFTFIFRRFMKYEYRGIILNNVESNLEPNSMTGDILVHQISRLVFNSTDNIILSSFTSLSTVGMYSSYNMIVSNVVNIINKVIEGTRSSLSIKINNNDKNAYNIFKQVISLSIFLGNIITCVFILLINKFVILWLGDGFVLDNICIILFGTILYQSIILPISNIAKDSKGLFKESKWYTILQSIINGVISILLVKKLGIAGVLVGTVIARGLITLPCNYNLVYRKVFNKEVEIKEFIFSIIFIVFGIASGDKILNMLFNGIEYGWMYFICQAIFITFYISFSCFFFMYLTDNHFKEFVLKIKKGLLNYYKLRLKSKY